MEDRTVSLVCMAYVCKAYAICDCWPACSLSHDCSADKPNVLCGALAVHCWKEHDKTREDEYPKLTGLCLADFKHQSLLFSALMHHRDNSFPV